MKYVLLIATDPAEYEQCSEDEMNQMMSEYFAFSARITETGEMVAGEALQGISTATTLQIRDGVTSVTDGPFAETKEHFGGFYVVDVASLDRALELAAQIPDAKLGRVEVRPVMEFDQP